MKCEYCGHAEDVRPEDSRTFYHDPVTRYSRLLEEDPLDPEDPNRAIWLCRECAAQYHEYWDEMHEIAQAVYY